MVTVVPDMAHVDMTTVVMEVMVHPRKATTDPDVTAPTVTAGDRYSCFRLLFITARTLF